MRKTAIKLAVVTTFFAATPFLPECAMAGLNFKYDVIRQWDDVEQEYYTIFRNYYEEDTSGNPLYTYCLPIYPRAGADPWDIFWLCPGWEVDVRPGLGGGVGAPRPVGGGPAPDPPPGGWSRRIIRVNLEKEITITEIRDGPVQVRDVSGPGAPGEWRDVNVGDQFGAQGGKECYQFRGPAGENTKIRYIGCQGGITNPRGQDFSGVYFVTGGGWPTGHSPPEFFANVPQTVYTLVGIACPQANTAIG